MPAGVAETLAIGRDVLIPLGAEGLIRPVRFVARKSMFSRPLVQSFYREVLSQARHL